MELLTERDADEIAGVLSCYDRILIFGTLPHFCYAEGMTGYLYAHHIRIFDYPRFAQPLRDTLGENAERLAAENGLTIEYLRKNDFRKEKSERDFAEAGEPPGWTTPSRTSPTGMRRRDWPMIGGGKLSQQVQPILPGVVDRREQSQSPVCQLLRQFALTLVNIRTYRYHSVASSMNFRSCPVLRGPEEASHFHNITASALLAVGFSFKKNPRRFKTQIVVATQDTKRPLSLQ